MEIHYGEGFKLEPGRLLDIVENDPGITTSEQLIETLCENGETLANEYTHNLFTLLVYQLIEVKLVLDFTIYNEMHRDHNPTLTVAFSDFLEYGELHVVKV